MSVKDITGQRFGRLIVIELTNKRTSSGGVFWRCLCDCGKIALVSVSPLRAGTTKSCGCYKKERARASGRKTAKDIIGQRFFRLVAIKPTDIRIGKSVAWECQCDCGRITLAKIGNLLFGRRKSCGCLQLANQFVRGTNINPMDVPFEILHLMKARSKLERAIKQAS